MKPAHPADSGGDRRSRFASLAEAGSNFTGSLLFSVLCVLLVVAFVLLYAVDAPLGVQIFVGDLMSAVTLLLLALLKNSERRAERAIQRKLDAIAAAILAEQEGRPGEAQDDLRNAIRMEDEI
ncbi:hypothetical protein RMN57_01940 [Kitasatospora sp. CM 4170]|uniref:Low affinity iron permease n=1 Tax=Kitasatospora aburaviensis TaxID=67265 RepID=A0ABW1F051_9ACTN|nr:hypothetical protein [Kitasatospora sp. CM 4170]WNM43545.1 hypothetical protein RMN57_01940 [Kitasatospora sp. CM 4170]